MKFFQQRAGRRHFISAGSMALGVGMLAKPPRLWSAAVGSSQPVRNSNTDGTKYGKYITLSGKHETTERGIDLFDTMGTTFPGFSTVIIGRMPPPGPMPGHESHEKHDGEKEFLIHLGNDPDDPMNLGADVELYLGRGKWREKYTFNRTTAVYLPSGFWHCPWHVQKIRKDMTWVNVRIGGESAQGGIPPGGQGAPPPALSQDALSAEELARAKTSGYIFEKFMLSGGVKSASDPKGGKMIAYADCTTIAEAPLTRIIRYRPEGAFYSIIDAQTHEYGTLLLFLGTELMDPTDLGAEVELSIGPEGEKHTIHKSAIVYMPAELTHGPFKVKKADKPFNFLEIVAGPEMPGAVYG
jgi:hypothetical protein